MAAMTITVQKHITAEHHHLPPSALVPSSAFGDNLQCFTTFEPRADPTDATHLLSLVIPSEGKGVLSTKPAFAVDIMENFINPAIVAKARVQGYKDFKYMLYGNMSSSPLSLKINVHAAGTALLCQPPGNWGKLPNGFKTFWEVSTKIFLTANVVDMDKFVFMPSSAAIVKYSNRTKIDHQPICVTLDNKLTPGNHVLTLVPTTSENVAFTYLLLP